MGDMGGFSVGDNKDEPSTLKLGFHDLLSLKKQIANYIDFITVLIKNGKKVLNEEDENYAKALLDFEIDVQDINFYIALNKEESSVEGATKFLANFKEKLSENKNGYEKIHQIFEISSMLNTLIEHANLISQDTNSELKLDSKLEQEQEQEPESEKERKQEREQKQDREAHLKFLQNQAVFKLREESLQSRGTKQVKPVSTFKKGIYWAKKNPLKIATAGVVIAALAVGTVLSFGALGVIAGGVAGGIAAAVGASAIAGGIATASIVDRKKNGRNWKNTLGLAVAAVGIAVASVFTAGAALGGTMAGFALIGAASAGIVGAVPTGAAIGIGVGGIAAIAVPSVYLLSKSKSNSQKAETSSQRLSIDESLGAINSMTGDGPVISSTRESPQSSSGYVNKTLSALSPASTPEFVQPELTVPVATSSKQVADAKKPVISLYEEVAQSDEPVISRSKGFTSGFR